MLAEINRNVSHAFRLDREYIIVCNEHKGVFAGTLLFWGHKTEDNEKRSFGGYTSDIDKCEMYTLKEIEEKNYRFPVYEEGMSFYDFIKLNILNQSHLPSLFSFLRQSHDSVRMLDYPVRVRSRRSPFPDP